MTDKQTIVEGGAGDRRPSVTYWHAWTDRDGVSHQTQGVLRHFEQQSMGGAAPQWNDRLGAAGATVLVSVQPVGWVGDWHENPRPQWIIPLSGRWWVETMDGVRIEMGPGDVSFGEDQNCTTDGQGRKGHRSGTIGDEAAVLMIVQLDETPTVGRPGAGHRSMDGVDILDPRFAAYVLPNAPLEKLGEGFRWAEGPVWFGDADMLLFSDVPNSRVMRWTEASGVSLYRQDDAFENGHARDRQGRLVSCSHRHRRLTRTELDGTRTVLADRFEGRRLNSPNDVVVRSDGSIWFTDPPYGINTDYEGGKQASESPPRVYRLDPATGALSVAAGDMAGPNGLCFSPDERLLYVAETGEQFAAAPRQVIRVYDVAGAGLANGRDLHKVAPGFADGLCCDDLGNLWSSAADGVHCIDPAGRLLGKIRVPFTVSNLRFGGRNRSRLFICASHTLFAIYTNRRGVTAP